MGPFCMIVEMISMDGKLGWAKGFTVKMVFAGVNQNNPSRVSYSGTES
jgi:hypothetical protein